VIEITCWVDNYATLGILKSPRNPDRGSLGKLRKTDYLLMTNDAMRHIRLFQVCDLFLGQFYR